MIIDGKQIAEEILAELKKEVLDKKLDLSLGAVLVGDDPEFKKFVEFKSKAADKVEISPTIYPFPKDIGMADLKKDLAEIIKWSDGVLVELPLPKDIDQQEILNMVPVDKDVDVLSDEAQKLFYDNKSKINPPAVEALKIVMEINDISLAGKKVAVFGQGILIGKPISHWLEQQGSEVFRIRSTTKNPEKLSLEADIVISGVGKPELITGDMVKEGAVVIDFGYSKKGDASPHQTDKSHIAAKQPLSVWCGDVDFIPVAKKSSLITPVPGGMGPILIAVVLKNLIKLNS